MKQIKWDNINLTDRENQLIGYMIETQFQIIVTMQNHLNADHKAGGIDTWGGDRVLTSLQGHFPNLNFRLVDDESEIEDLPPVTSQGTTSPQGTLQQILTMCDDQVKQITSIGEVLGELPVSYREFIERVRYIILNSVPTNKGKTEVFTTISGSTIFNGMPTHCPQCKAEYRHMAHPRTGASMVSVCDCTVKYIPSDTGMVMIMEPPTGSIAKEGV